MALLRGPVWPEDFDNTIYGFDGLTDWCRHNGVTSPTECKKKNFTGVKQSMQVDFPPGFFKISNIGLKVGVIFYTIITLCCLLMTIFFTIVLIRGWRSHFQFPIYRIILQLSISYLLISSSQFFTNIPLYLFNFNSDKSITLVPFFVEQTAYYGAVLFYTLLTINRLAIFSTKLLRDLFVGTSLHGLIIVGWALAVFSASFMMIYGCRRVFDDKKNMYVDQCSPQASFLFTIYKIIFYTFLVLPLINVLLYVLIGISIVLSRQGSTISISKSEIDLLKQSALIFLLYMITIIIAIIQPLIEFKEVATVYITTMLVGVMDPLLGIIFVGTFIGSNKTVRKAIREEMPRQISRFFGKKDNEPELLFMRTATHTATSEK